MLVALGIALGIGVHVIYSIVGLAVVVSQSILLFNVIKYAGAVYLIWIGVKALRSLGEKTAMETSERLKPQTSFKYFRQGFLTNLLNPKVTLFFLSLFTQIIKPDTSPFVKALYGAEMIVLTFVWFALVAVLMTQKPMQLMYDKSKTIINRTFGVLLIGLGLKVASS